MKLVAVSVGRPREVESRGRMVRTSIVKTPIAGRVHVRFENIDGDEQSDLTVHGGPNKAVYAYPSEHYAPWRLELPDTDFHWGAFGENLTTEGLIETDVRIGDRYRIGTGEFVVTQPRQPCYKLQVRFGRLDMTRRFARSGRSGFYLRVEREGEVGAGDAIELIEPNERGQTIADVFARVVESR